MIVTRKIAKIDTTNKMTVSFDVGQKNLNYYSEIRGKVSGTSCREIQEIRDEIRNTTMAIQQALKSVEVVAKENGYAGLHVVCEPTGCYSDCLLRTAHRMGHTTAYVGGESVSKAKIIENNDNSKNDTKDPRTIFMLSKMGKELTYRVLPTDYAQLRELNRMYDEADERCTEQKGRLHHMLVRMFCDFPMGKDFIYSNSGLALMEHFGFNPYRITAVTCEEFEKKMRGSAPGIRTMNLKKLYINAKYSTLHHIPAEEYRLIEQHFRYIWDDVQQELKRKAHLRAQIEAYYPRLWAAGELMPMADPTVLKPFQICRFLGETGPLRDFAHWRVLLKFAGVNLRVRESGKFKGQLKFSKKGRSDLRRVAGKLVFRLVRKHEIYGPYFQKKKAASGNAPGTATKVMGNVERKLLRLFFSLGRQREAFNEERFTKCESQYRLAA
jgi:transposase